jgi:negative regulator of sigma E activity
LRVEVQEGGTAEVVATFERTETESLSLLDADSDTLLFWLGQLDDPETAQQLSELADQQQEIVRTKTEISDIERELDNAFVSQERIRENLAAVPGESALAQRYLSQLEEQEDMIADLEERRGEAEQRLTQLRDAFNRAVEAL